MSVAMRAYRLLAYYCSSAYFIHWFFGLIFVSIVLFLLLFAKDTEAILRKQAQMPLIELYDFTIYKTTNNYVELLITGEKALRFQEYEQSFHTLIQQITASSAPISKALDISYLYGQEVIRKDQVYTFPLGAVYAKSVGEAFASVRATYNAEKGVVMGEGEFWASSLEGSMQGFNLIYNQRLQTAQATNVTAHILLPANSSQE